MDQITASIVGALAAGVLGGITQMGTTAITDAYENLKRLLSKKFGAGSGVMQAITQLEAKPDSPHRQGVLDEELLAVNASQDAEVLAAARYLQAAIQQQQKFVLYESPVHGSIYQNQVGGNQYQVAGNQYNTHGELVGPKTRHGAKRVIGLLLIVGGLLISLPAAAMLPYANALSTELQNVPVGSSFGTSMLLLVYVSIGLGIVVMVIGGILLGRDSKSP